jgi:cyclohexa-1,5-dienecarbonyl-CoA hydratase
MPEEEAMSQHVRKTVEEGLVRLTIDRPPLNVLTTEMLETLAERLEEVSRLDEIRLVRLDAVGKAFSAGVDVADHLAGRVPAMMRALGRLFDAFERVPVPTVAVVQGPALGGGCELALGTDLCVASERASFGQPEIKLGVFAPPASVLLPRVVGPRRAMEMLLTGETIDAREAERIGLVNRLFPDDRFEEGVRRWQQGLLSLSAAALRHAKRAVRDAMRFDSSEARRRIDRQYEDELMRTADAGEGLGAFLEKRPPEWKHR